MYSIILNKAYLQVKAISYKRAIKLLLSGRKHAQPCYEYQLYTLEEWQTIAPTIQSEKDRYLKTISGRFYVPRYIYLPKGKIPKSSPRLTRWNLYIRDKGRCRYCGKRLTRKQATRDHIVPLSQGGTTDWLNVVLCCRECNQRKGNLSLIQLGWERPKTHVPTWAELILLENKLKLHM